MIVARLGACAGAPAIKRANGLYDHGGARAWGKSGIQSTIAVDVHGYSVDRFRDVSESAKMGTRRHESAILYAVA